MQSKTAFGVFLRDQAHRFERPIVIAKVELWGHVAPHAPDDDWKYTCRAEYAAISGPVWVPARLQQAIPGLKMHYGITTES